jgi:hypothetical protein
MTYLFHSVEQAIEKNNTQVTHYTKDNTIYPELRLSSDTHSSHYAKSFGTVKGQL